MLVVLSAIVAGEAGGRAQAKPGAAPPVADYYQIAVGTMVGDPISSAQDINSGGTSCTLRDALGIVNDSKTSGPVNGCDITQVGSPASLIYVINLPTYTYTLSGTQLTITANSVFVVGQGSASTIIQAAAATNTVNYRVLEVSGASTSVELSGLTLRNGGCDGVTNNPPCTSAGPTSGGGIFNDGGTLTLDASTVSGNSATFGGGINNTGGGNVTIQNGSTIGGVGAGNSATNSGGGIHNVSSATLTVDASAVSANSATNWGGGIHNSVSGSVTIKNGSTIGGVGAGNSAGINGGGIFNKGSGSTLTLDASTVSNNTATSSGGGILNNAGSVTVQNGSTIGGAGAGNTATNNGGGISNFNGTLTLTASAVSANTATDGGGINNDGGGDVTIQNGSTIGGAGVGNTASNNGGGIYSIDSGSTLTLNASTVSGNTATLGGGGIYNDASTLMLDASTASDNTASFAGGIYNTTGGQTNISNSIVSGNTATEFGGGGISNWGIDIASGSTVTIDASTISGNTADSATGGGIYNVASTLTVDASTVSDNSAGTTGGGGVRNTTGGEMNISNSTVSGNTSTSDGGGILNNFSSEVNVSGSTIFDNTAAMSGGGLSNSVGTANLTNTTVSGNRANLSGGGIDNYDSTLNLSNITITNNTADFDNNNTGTGGGLYTGVAVATANVKNSILANNVDNNIATHDCSGTLTLSSYNLIEVVTGCGGTSGTDIIGNDPLLGALQNNGGPTETHELLVGSPAINAGDPSGCTDHNAVAVTTDQRGFARPVGAACDIGAYEAVDVLVNGSFEKFEPRQWWSWKTTSADGPTCAQAQSGNCSVMFSGDGTSKNFATAANLSGSAGDNFTASTWYRASNASGSGPFRMRVRLVYTDDTEETFNFGLTGGTHGWQLKTVNVVASKDYTKVKFFVMYGKSGGEVGFDNVSLARDAPATGNLLPNFDFEQAEPVKWNGNGNITFQDGAACSIPQDGACTLQINGNGSTKKYFFKDKSGGSAGDNLAATIWNRTSAANGGGGWNVVIKFFYSDATTENFKVNFNSGTHGWQETMVNATAAKDYTQVRLIVTYAKSGGAVYLDAAQLLKN